MDVDRAQERRWKTGAPLQRAAAAAQRASELRQDAARLLITSRRLAQDLATAVRDLNIQTQRRSTASPGDARSAVSSRPTPRELAVVDLMARGLTNRQIARRLGIGQRTVESHADHLYAKLGVRTRTEAALWYCRAATNAAEDRAAA